MREQGIVTKTENGMATVLVKRKSACGDNCATCKAACSLGERGIIVKNDIDAKTGDEVAFEMDTAKVLKTAFLVYILPILVFFAAFIICDKFLENQSCAIFASLIPSAAVFGILMLYDRKNKELYIPRIVEIMQIGT